MLSARYVDDNKVRKKYQEMDYVSHLQRVHDINQSIKKPVIDMEASVIMHHARRVNNDFVSKEKTLRLNQQNFAI